MKTKQIAFYLLIASMLAACGAKPSASSSVNSSTPTSSESKEEPSSSASSSVSSQDPSSSSKIESSSSVSNKITVTITNGTGSGQYEIGQMVKIDCTVPEGYEFEAWKEGNTVFSKTKEYSFIASRDITLTASFIEIKNSFANIAELKAFLTSKDSEYKSKVTEASYEHYDAFVSNEYQSTSEKYKESFYKDAMIKDGTVGYGYSADADKLTNIKHTEIFASKNNVYYNINKYDPSDTTYRNSAVKKSITSMIDDENSQISTSQATAKIKNNAVEVLNNYLTTKFTSSANIIQNRGTTSSVTYIQSRATEGNFYVDRVLSVTINDTTELLEAALYNELYYVKATVDAAGDSDAGIAPSKYIMEKYNFTYGTQTNMPNTYDLNSYFITSFDVEANYYDKNASRKFGKDFKYLPMDASISIYQFDIVEESVLPRTYLEELKIANVISSDETVVKYENSTIKTLKAGKVNLTFVTTQGAKCTYEVEVKPLAPYKIEITSADTVKVGERIELSATVSPTTASNELEWSVDNASLAKIVKENNKVYLEGVAEGNVKVKAASKEDSTKYGEKLISVTKGAQSADSLGSTLVGEWHNFYSTSPDINNFVAIFNADGTFQLIDNYRSAAFKFTGNGNYEILSTPDTEITHVGTYVGNYPDYFVIQVTNYVLTGDNAGSYYVNLHFLIKNDGSKIYLHVQANATESKVATSNTLQYEFIKA